MQQTQQQYQKQPCSQNTDEYLITHQGFKISTQLHISHQGDEVPRKCKLCTLKFFCLGSPKDEKPPQTVSLKAQLSNCGLGAASLTLNSNDIVHQSLLERYPLLQAAGGHELLMYKRAGADQGFHPIHVPYTPLLKDLARHDQIYIRPLQKDIMQDGETQKYQDENYYS